MKRILPLLILLYSLPAQAQILNGGFEQQRTLGGPAHWGQLVLMPFPCSNTAGFDSVYFQSPDAHSGNYALEIRNAFCDSGFFAGGAHLMENDSFYFDFGVPYTTSPLGIQFYYKFFPQGGDEISVHIELLDTDGFLMADADYPVTQTTPNYTYATISFNYLPVIAAPGRIGISFKMINPASHVHFGSRFLVDDLGEQIIGTHVNESMKEKNELTLYPNPAKDFIILQSADKKPAELILMDVAGRKISQQEILPDQPVSIRDLQTGFYIYQLIQSDKKTASGKLIVY